MVTSNQIPPHAWDTELHQDPEQDLKLTEDNWCISLDSPCLPYLGTETLLGLSCNTWTPSVQEVTPVVFSLLPDSAWSCLLDAAWFTHVSLSLNLLHWYPVDPTRLKTLTLAYKCRKWTVMVNVCVFCIGNMLCTLCYCFNCFSPPCYWVGLASAFVGDQAGFLVVADIRQAWAWAVGSSGL